MSALHRADKRRGTHHEPAASGRLERVGGQTRAVCDPHGELGMVVGRGEALQAHARQDGVTGWILKEFPRTHTGPLGSRIVWPRPSMVGEREYALIMISWSIVVAVPVYDEKHIAVTTSFSEQVQISMATRREDRRTEAHLACG